MTIQTTVINSAPKKESERHKPKVIKWKGVSMVRQHSFLAAVKEIVTHAEEMDLTRIGLIGDPHVGKSTMARALSHSIHQKSKHPWAIRILGKQELLNFKETLASIDPVNTIFIFDDVSFMGANAAKGQIEMVKQAVTEIRHLPGGEDVKIIAIMNYHYSLGLDKYLRQADFRFFLSVGSSETENFEKIFGTNAKPLITLFKKLRRQGIQKKYFSLRIGKKKCLRINGAGALQISSLL